MNTNEFNIFIKKFKAVSFFSVHRNLSPINHDISLSSHPHNDITDIEAELKEKYRFVRPVFFKHGSITLKNSNNPIPAGFLYSNNINVGKIKL